MSVVFPRCAVMAIALSSTAAFAAAPEDAGMEALLERSPAVTFSTGVDAGKPTFRGRLEQFANGDTLLRVGEGEGVPVMLIVCSQSGWINPVGETGSTAPLPVEQLKAMRMMQYMVTLTGVAMVQGVGGEALKMPTSLQPVSSTGSHEWAYGREQFEVSARQVDGQGVLLRTRKTSHGAAGQPADPDAMFSTDDDRAARLAELEPVGTWREVIIDGGERPPAVPADMSLRGWVSSGEGAAVATAGEARRSCSTK